MVTVAAGNGVLFHDFIGVVGSEEEGTLFVRPLLDVVRHYSTQYIPPRNRVVAEA